MQQMLSKLTTYYTSRNSCSQDSFQNNGKKDQSLVKTSQVTLSGAVGVASAQNKLIMVDQDAPLDLSVKKIKVEDIQQDGVLDLSTKKNLSKDHLCLKNSHVHVSPDAHLVKRDSIDLSLAQVGDLQSASTLEQFMSKLCLHHQHQIVDALGFLQSEVKTVSNHFQAPISTLSEKQATTSCSTVSSESRSEVQRPERTCSVDAALSIKTQSVARSQITTLEDLNADVSSIATCEKTVDICKQEDFSSSSSCGTVVESGNASSPVTKTTTDHQEIKKSLGSSLQQVKHGDSVKKCLCSAERCTCTAASDQEDLLSKHTDTSSVAQNEDAVVNPSTVHKTSNVVLSVSPRTARKSRKGSCLRPRNGSLSCIISDPDSHCDLVYIKKSIIECQPQSRNRLHPRLNARKSTRGHKYVEEYLELKTVRTLARKPIHGSIGNCPVLLADLQTSVTPRQTLSGSVPLVNAPFTGDCMKNIIQKLSSEQIAEEEMPGDVVKVTGISLMVETSHTDKTETNSQISHEPSCKESEASMQIDVSLETVSCTPNAVEVPAENIDVEEAKESTETTELAVETEQCDPPVVPIEEEQCDPPVVPIEEVQCEHPVVPIEEVQCEHPVVPIEKEVDCGTESKAKCEDQSLEPSLSPASHNMDPESSTIEINVEQNNERESTSLETDTADVQEPSEASEVKINTEEDKNAQEQTLGDVDTNLQMLPEKEEEDLSGSKIAEVSTLQPLANCKDTDSITPKVLNTKHTVSSDRCLRSRVSKGSVDVVKDSVKHGASEPVDHANDANTKTQSAETSVCTGEEHNSEPVEIPIEKPNHQVITNAVKTTPKAKGGKAKQQSPKVEMNELPSVLPPEVLPETISTASNTTESEKQHKMKCQASENLTLRSKSSPIELLVSGDCSPNKKSPHSSENMLLRSRSNTERLAGSKSNSLTEGHLETQGQTPLRGNGSASDQGSIGDLCTPSESVTRMPLRSRTISANKQSVTRESPVKGSIKSEPVSSPSSKRTEATGHMPLRSSAGVTAEQPCNDKSALESPGRMSLRRGNTSNTEKPCGSTTPPTTNKRPSRIHKVSASSSGDAEEIPSSSKLEIQNKKHTESQIKGSDESFHVSSLQRSEPIVCNPSRFLEALRGEEHQQLISNLNAKFDKMQKGWVQIDKEGQGATKNKNKADRLKEIWKSKRRVRKSRPLEQQKFSPVQMLFMKPFDLTSICRWFLQSTETKSLVIVKKVNTRLPSETQLCFHSSSAGAGSANGIFPSLQAERLKKHLKKFAIASPVKSNPKNQRLISKALGQGISVMSKEKPKPTTATRICTKAQSLAGVTPVQVPESISATAGSAKNPASARILRKYSNMREKLQVQQNKKCKEKALKSASLKATIIPKKDDKEKLQMQKGPKSEVVKKISSLSKTAKANSVLKERVLKSKGGSSTKRLQGLKRITKAIGAHASANKLSKKLIRTDRAQRVKTIKVDSKKSALQKIPSEPQTLDVDNKSSEDQVLTRSQRKMEGAPPQTASPKSAMKRGLEPLVTPTKRTRTSKP
ncbi:uncharacterized protein wu:fc17b08 [Danio aesculapii]|uniref:uncharacterized protein wu:fc17b08 n=1 Tax=Danio aesculapii TaxID=1142201 RepID=UPI0024C016CA|nr:uncharacterized protein wu:fc17b08 [Danio aesculapii]XP_056326637.1 uncharacterized protein wu:fc17b08 [Danio aesculapii]